MLLKHSAIYILGRVLSGVLGMAATAILTRLVSPDSYGRYGAILIAMAFMCMLCFDWLKLAYLRFGKYEEDEVVKKTTFALIFLLIAAVLWIGIDVFAVAYRPDEETSSVIGMGYILALCSGWCEIVAQFEVSSLRPGRYLLIAFARTFYSLIGTALAAWLTHDPVWIAAGTAVGTLLAALPGTVTGIRLTSRSFNPALAAEVVRFGLPMALSLGLTSLTNAGARTLVGALGTLAALGVFTVALNLFSTTLVMIAGGIESATYAIAVAALERRDPAALQKQLLLNGGLIFAVLAPLSLGIALTAHDAATCLLAPQYVDGVTRLAPWIVAGQFLGSIRGTYLDKAFQLGKKPEKQAWITGTAGVISMILGFFLVPGWGAVGASMAVTAAMALACFHAWYSGRSALRVPLPFVAMAKTAVACLALGIAVLAVPDVGILPLAEKVAGGGIAYVAVAVILDLLGVRAALVRLVPLWQERSERRAEPEIHSEPQSLT